MASTRMLLEILACPEDKGPLVLLRRRGRAVQPPAPAPLRHPRRHPRDADRRGRDGVRRGARAAHGQGRGRGHATHLRGRVTATSMDRCRQRDVARQPGHARGRPRPARAGGRARATRPGGSTACPTAEEIEQVVVLGMGGSGIAGDVLMAAAGPVPAAAGPGLPELPRARVRRRGHARVRHLLLGRHRGDDRGGHRRRPPGRPGGGRHQRRRAGPPGRVVGRAGGRRARRHSPAPCRPRRPGHPAPGRPGGDRPVPRRHLLDRRRRRAAQAPARPAGARPTTWPSSWPAASAAPCR